MVKLRALLTGLASFVPGLYSTLYKASGAGGGLTQSAEYCHLTWLTHLAVASKAGLTSIPQKVVELGPGLSLGSGISALLCGAEEYHALDAIPYSETSTNIKLVDELADLLNARFGIPLDREYPAIVDLLGEDGVPEILMKNLDYTRVADTAFLEELRKSLSKVGTESQDRFFYHAPWDRLDILEENSIDLLFSKAVLEHVEDVLFTHQAAYRWLKPGGYVVHRIDFGCHGTSTAWNGQWAMGEFTWKVVRGKRPYSINRSCLGDHRRALKEAGFTILLTLPQIRTDGIPRERFAPNFRAMDQESAACRQVFLVARKNE